MRNYHVYKIEAAGDFNLWSMLWHDTQSDQWGLYQLRVSGEFTPHRETAIGPGSRPRRKLS